MLAMFLLMGDSNYLVCVFLTFEMKVGLFCVFNILTKSIVHFFTLLKKKKR